MVHPAAYIEFRKWHYGKLGYYPRSFSLAWHWCRQFISSAPAIAPVALKDVRHPIYLRPWSSDLYVFDQIFVQKEYATDLPVPRSILDAGANIGLASIYFANRFPTARIVAVEPDDTNFRVLKENVKRYPNVVCVKAAIWHCSAPVVIQNSQDKSWAFRVEESKDLSAECVLEGISIDRISEKYNQGATFDLVKIDIEGAEKDVFATGGKWIANAMAILVECHDRIKTGCEAMVSETMASAAFKQRRSGEYLVFERSQDRAGIHE